MKGPFVVCAFILPDSANFTADDSTQACDIGSQSHLRLDFGYSPNDLQKQLQGANETGSQQSEERGPH